MSRVKTFDSTGLATAGRLYAGDLNAIQDQYADLVNLAQAVSVGSLAVGEAGLQLLRYGAGEARISGMLRIDGIVRALGGFYGGAFTTTARDAIPLGSRPYGLVILNSTTNQYEWNSGSDATPVWTHLGGGDNEIPTRLYQGLVAGAAATIYTVPGTKQTKYRTARLYNSDTVARTVTLYDGGTGAGNIILPVTEIPAGDFIELDMRGMVGAPGGTLAAVASAAGVVAMTVYGSEEDIGSSVYRRLGQLALSTAYAAVKNFTTRTRVTHIRAVNTNTTTNRGVGLADGGSAAANIIQGHTSPSAVIPPLGVMEIDETTFMAFANGGTLQARQDVGTDVILTAYGIEE